MSWGEVYTKDFSVISSIAPGQPFPKNDNPFARCCYKLCVFADPVDNNIFKNDVSGPQKFYPVIYSNVQMWLQKDGFDLVQLNGNTAYGTPFENLPPYQNVKMWGYQLEWQKVLIAEGVGSYRIRFEYDQTNLLSDYSETYCLRPFSNYAADKSVRITFTRDRSTGDLDQKKKRHFLGFSWTDQIRFCKAIFGYPTLPIESEENRYASGLQKRIAQGGRKTYRLEVEGLPYTLHNVFMHDILQSSDIVISDYNSKNTSGDHVEIQVSPVGAYEPEWVGQNPQTPVVVEFVDAFDNQRMEYNGQ